MSAIHPEMFQSTWERGTTRFPVLLAKSTAESGEKGVRNSSDGRLSCDHLLGDNI
jgi:hypothetical protein